MRLRGRSIGFAVTGSHCTITTVLPVIKQLVEVEGARVTPVFSEAVAYTDTRFGTSKLWKEKFERLTGNKVLCSITETEPIGPNKLLDVLVVAPCTGNTVAKLANAITDSAVLMAVKAQLRNSRPVVLALSTNDGLGANLKNLGLVMNFKNIFLVPFGQDNPQVKPNSVVARMELIPATIIAALQNKQIQPVLVAFS